MDEDAEEEDQEFDTEHELRNFLVRHPGCIEPGLVIYEAEDRRGVELPIDGGRGYIDILAVDGKGCLVVIELKVGKGRNKAVGQLLYYMGWVDQHLGKAPCRGMIIAKEIPDDLVLAVKRTSGVSLHRYKLSVSVEPV